MSDPLTSHQIEALMSLDADTYIRRVVTLFRTRRATPAQWTAMTEAVCRCHDIYARGLAHRLRTHTASTNDYRTMAEAVLTVSESSDGDVVACLDRAILALAPPQAQAHSSEAPDASL
jgi:hypothetical protein